MGESATGPLVSVVLPVRNEAAHIEDVLADLRAQEFPADRVEVLVVDGESTDDTRERVRRVASADPRVRLLENPARLSSAARALGARESRGLYVAYVDGHCRIPSRTWLADHVEAFERTGARCLARPQPLDRLGGGYRARAIAAARHSPFGHSVRSTIFGDAEGPVDPTSSGAAYRREVFDVVGTFDAAFDACEDVEFNHRVAKAGLLAWSSPKFAVEYAPRGSYRALFRQMYRYGLGRARLHRKHRDAFRVEALAPAAFAAGLPVLAASPLLPSPGPLVVAAPYALYALLAVLFGVLSASRRGATLFPGILVAFPTIHAGLGLGYLIGRLARPAGGTS
jgi:glycosyltransferase involved in cell wall biosynthesis